MWGRTCLPRRRTCTLELATFTDLGPDHATKHLNPDRLKRNHIRQLEALGYTVTLTLAA